jgi:hypothetical protein
MFDSLSEYFPKRTDRRDMNPQKSYCYTIVRDNVTVILSTKNNKINNNNNNIILIKMKLMLQ